MMRRAFGASPHMTPPSEKQGTFDIRVPGNFSVESKDGTIFVYGGEIAERILFRGEAIAPDLLAALGSPDIVVVFCHYDSGESFGYTIAEQGQRTRTRLHTLEKTSDEGTPRDIELSWVKAEPFIDEDEMPALRNCDTDETAPDAYVSAILLDLVMQHFFGVVPWEDWDYRTTFNHYQRR